MTDAWDDPLPGRMALDDEADVHDGLFEGDEGTLPLAARQALVAVLKQYTITRGGRWWHPLMEHRVAIKARLNDMFLDLHVDEQLGVAYKVQVRDGQFGALLRESRFNREQTILLVFFRRRHDAAHAAGSEKAFVERSECMEHVAQYRPATATDLKGDQDRVDNAIDSLLKMRVIKADKENPSRLEVMPVIASLLPVGRLKELLAWLHESSVHGDAVEEPEEITEEDEDD